MQTSALLRRFIPQGIYAAILGFAVFGFPWEGATVMTAPELHYDSIWPWINGSGGLVIPGLNIDVAHPYLFLLAAGFGLGLWGWPFVREYFQRRDNLDAFYKQWASAEFGKTKSDLFKYLSRGYESWKAKWKGSKLPESFNEFIEDAPYPDWLKGNALDTNYHSRIDLHTPYWAFANDLYREVGDYIFKRKTPELLSEAEAEEFHLARQRFAYFWSVTADQWERGQLKYEGLKEFLRRDQRILNAVCHMEVILHSATNQKGAGKTELFDLCRKFFQDR